MIREATVSNNEAHANGLLLIGRLSARAHEVCATSELVLHYSRLTLMGFI